MAEQTHGFAVGVLVRAARQSRQTQTPGTKGRYEVAKQGLCHSICNMARVHESTAQAARISDKSYQALEEQNTSLGMDQMVYTFGAAPTSSDRIEGMPALAEPGAHSGLDRVVRYACGTRSCC